MSSYVDYNAIARFKANMDAKFASKAETDALAGDVKKNGDNISELTKDVDAMKVVPEIEIHGPGVVYVDSDSNLSVETFEFSFVPDKFYVNVDLVSVEVYDESGNVSDAITPVDVMTGGFKLGIDSSKNLTGSFTIVCKLKVGNATKEVSKSIRIGDFLHIGQHEFVDLGLPSGLLWATCNIGASTPYTYQFMAFQWGEVEGNPIADKQTDTGDRIYDDSHYERSDIGASFSPTSGYDAAREKWGGAWRMPTTSEFRELYDNCTNVWTTINGINGRLFTSKINGKTVFFPACGDCGGSSRDNRGSFGDYWSSSWTSSSSAYYLYFNSTNINPQYRNTRYRGRAVRPVL